MIGDGVGQKRELADIAPSNKITLGFLKTYTNISDLLVCLDDKPDGRGMCNAVVLEEPGFCHEFKDFLKTQNEVKFRKIFHQFHLKLPSLNFNGKAAQFSRQISRSAKRKK